MAVELEPVNTKPPMPMPVSVPAATATFHPKRGVVVMMSVSFRAWCGGAQWFGG